MTERAVATFYREVLTGNEVFHLHGEEGMPLAPMAGGYAAPFWSTRERAERAAATLPKFEGYGVERVTLDAWRENWLANLSDDGIRIGLNWSRRDGSGYVLDAADVYDELRQAERTS